MLRRKLDWHFCAYKGARCPIHLGIRTNTTLNPPECISPRLVSSLRSECLSPQPLTPLSSSRRVCRVISRGSCDDRPYVTEARLPKVATPSFSKRRSQTYDDGQTGLSGVQVDSWAASCCTGSLMKNRRQQDTTGVSSPRISGRLARSCKTRASCMAHFLNSYPFKGNGLMKMTISVHHGGSVWRLVSSYNLVDVRSGGLQISFPRSRSSICCSQRRHPPEAPILGGTEPEWHSVA